MEDLGATIETRLGLPQRRHLLLRHQVLNEARTATIIQDYLVHPRPYITTAPARLLGLLVGNEETAISVTSTDLYAELSRETPYATFVSPTNTQKRATAFVDPPVRGGAVVYSNRLTKEVAGGIRCRILHVDDSDPTLWKLILRREKD